jgi:hypothetical protein
MMMDTVTVTDMVIMMMDTVTVTDMDMVIMKMDTVTDMVTDTMVIMRININTKIMIFKDGVMNMINQLTHLSPLVIFLHLNPLNPLNPLHLVQKRDVMLVNIVSSIQPTLLNVLHHVITMD